MENRTVRSVHIVKRSTLAAALSVSLFSSYVIAQTSTGSIFGEAGAGNAVTIVNADTGLKRTIAADPNGRYTFPQLPTGHYKVTSGNNSRDVDVSVGTGREVNFSVATGTLGEITVTGNAINPIDVSSVESATVFSSEQLRALPVARDVSNVALLAPGTVKGDAGIGNGHLASFGGSSVAENGYYINGFDVTDIHKFVSFFSVPFDAISEEQVKTGGYGAEYGRSLGGVVSIVTKRGSNEFHAGGSIIWEPDALREQPVNRPDRTDPSEYYAFTANNRETDLTYDAYASGPIIRDRLFFYTLIEGQSNSFDTFNRDDSNHQTNTKPHALVKLDWNITDSHILEFTGVSHRDYTLQKNYISDTPYNTVHDVHATDYTVQNGGELYLGKYTGYLTDSLTLSAQAGQLTSLRDNQSPRNLPGADCPSAYDFRGGVALVKIGCWDINAFTINDPDAAPARDRRRAERLDVEWKLGNHTLRGGLDNENFNSTNIGSTYSGGVYWRYYKVPSSGIVNGVPVPAGTQYYVRKRIDKTLSGAFDIDNTAAYIEDSWQIRDNLLLYAGLRNETFNNKTSIGSTFAKADNLWAPRLGFSWDVRGDASDKLSGTFGRYYIPIAANTSIRNANAELLYSEYYLYGSIDPVTGAPIGLGQQLGGRVVTTDGRLPNPKSVTSTTLKPMFQDEAILAFQHAFTDSFSGGARGILRRVRNGMDDYCYKGGFADWAKDNGYNDFDPYSVPGCVILNPGKDNSFALDLHNDGNLTVVKIPAKYFHLPNYDRKYNAIELFFEKPWDGKWMMQGSYTWSHSYGDTEGYVNSNLQQDDAGVTADFDFASLENGAYGNLPNDRRHVFKLFGAVEVAPDWRVSYNALVESGAPRACLGYIPPGVFDYSGPGMTGGSQGSGSYGPDSFYCVDSATGKSVLHARGSLGRTPWVQNLDVAVSWQPHVWNGKLSLELAVFNVFNFQNALRLAETGDLNSGAPIHNPNYGQVVDFQSPRSARITARYEW